MAEPIIQDASENTPPVAIVEAPQDAPTARTVDLCDVEIKVTWTWWGYQLILNQPAVDKLTYCMEILEHELARIIHNAELRAAIEAILKIKEFRLTRVSRKTGSQGCRMVSPWICPVALTVVRNKADADLSLYTSVWDPSSQTWGEESAFTDIESACGPALAQYRDRLYCVYRGKGDDYNMYWMTYTSDDGWSDGSAEDKYPENQRPKQFPGHFTSGVPTLIVFQDKLYCFHKGAGDNYLWYCTFIPEEKSWTDDIRISVADSNGRTVDTKYGTGAAVFRGKLYLVFPESSKDGYLYQISSADGENWSQITPFKENEKDYLKGEDIPALAEYNDKLYMLIRGRDEHIWNTDTSDGTTWSKANKMAYSSWEGASLAVFKDKLVMVHRSSTRDGSLWACYYDGSSWSADTKFRNEQQTGDNPALVSYMDPNATTENYVDPNYAGPSLIAVYRGK